LRSFRNLLAFCRMEKYSCHQRIGVFSRLPIYNIKILWHDSSSQNADIFLQNLKMRLILFLKLTCVEFWSFRNTRSGGRIYYKVIRALEQKFSTISKDVKPGAILWIHSKCFFRFVQRRGLCTAV
jgi:hypothetical protein